ncbi:Multidrug export protein EmrA [Sporomusa ovata DSM 2662]|uniref:Predicted membrane fusion protein (MFP) component of efflux pump, membrane anchor protein YbhG n=1 Tax=Sporomusa ovata TaxID=2378 RepID=A0A0U1L5Q9_9FIRM|nr:efflux RND transporter periplasmic adaptor subunit [Sporomusa ovata]EQB24685.1 multidrug resistance efflux pump [Sporomusa ovata DSM 2662]CQR75032.1 Predicted membrane fusion protein (MFP) component of efflux pump, membrane anchor protein YbhG [Sporomusa ovata]
MKKRLRILIPLLLIALAFGVFSLYFKKPVNPHQIHVSGNMEVTTVGVGFKVPGHVTTRLVNEGASIQKGQLVAQLETADLELAVAETKSQLLAAQATLSELLNGSRRQDVSAAQAVVRRLETVKQNAAAEDQRAQKLFSMGAIATQERDRSHTTYEVATANYEEALQQLNLVTEGPRQEQLELAKARVQQAQDAVKLAETRLSYAQIISPINGVVLSENIESGEYVAAGTPIVTIGDIEHVWLKAYINETDLGRVKLGQKVTVTTDTYPGKGYNGTISFISSDAEFTPKTIQTKEERVKLVYRIKIAIENSAQELKPGMPVDAVISTEGV